VVMSAETLFGEMRNTRPSGKRQGGRRRRDYVNDRDEESDFQILAYSGGPMDEAISSLQKCIRLGREQGACYWGMQVWGKYPQYFWRRMMIICSEDCAADPMTAVQLQALYQNGCAAKRMRF
jgi:replication-associated recombination protein RarA